MNIAITGIRGIPGNYSGFETFAEELGSRLVERGHTVTVYGRTNKISYNGEHYKGVRLLLLPTISHKYLDTVVHTFLCICHILFRRYDVVLICNAANSIFSFIPRLANKVVIVNVDGIERKRKKWNWLGKAWYLLGEVFSVFFPNAIVTDARVIEDYYRQRYRKTSFCIPYGFDSQKVNTRAALDTYGLKPGSYFLYVSRLEPENNADVVIRAFQQLRTGKKLVIVGDAPYAEDFKKRLRDLATGNSNIIFTGFLFGTGYRELQSNAYCYVQATEVGGTHPALVEAMGFGNCVIANGTIENLEVIGDAALSYPFNDHAALSRMMRQVLDNPAMVRLYRAKARERIAQSYSWDQVTTSYETLFERFVKAKPSRTGVSAIIAM